MQTISMFCWIRNVLPVLLIDADVTRPSAPNVFSTRMVTVSADVGDGGVMTTPANAEGHDATALIRAAYRALLRELEL